MAASPSFTVGIEEEYLLVDRESRDLVSKPPDAFLELCKSLTDGQARPEFLRSQVEVGTGVCTSIDQAAEEIRALRRGVAKAAAEFGYAPIAASTHPFATWTQQSFSGQERYAALARDLQSVGRRLVTCGLHVHAGLDDNELRIDLMSQAGYFTPHLLALSTSSPFWRGADTGLKSYRIAVFNEVPRTGPAELFDSWGEYARHVDVLTGAGLIEDASKLWWDLRPSVRFPTLEMRITDMCSYWRDGIVIAAIYRSLLHMLWRLKRENQRWRRYNAMLIRENRWRAQRYGFDEGLVDFGKGAIIPYADLLEEIIALTAEDAEALGCTQWVEGARDILARGTSAHRQLAVHREALDAGQDDAAAMRAVVDFLIAETVRDL